MSNMNFNCDVCGREVYGCTFVNGMKFCAKCYQETFGETEKDRKIFDLQSQLAESEKDKQFYFFENGEKGLKIRELKQQLAEKNKEIEKLNACVDFYKSYYISFKGKVIDELEKVKSVINTSVRDDHIIWDFDIKAHIDNQINELKELK